MTKVAAGTEDGKPRKGVAKKHLHKIVTERITDAKGKHQGFVHHHVYKDAHDSPYEEPGRPMGTSGTPEEAGEHVNEQFAGAGAGGGEEEGEGEGGAASPQQETPAPQAE